MRIEKTALDAQNRCVYSLYKEKGCIGHAVTCADCFEALEIAPEWQSRGYGSYLLREVLRQNGGFDRTAPSEFTAPLPDAGNTAAQALAAKFGFVPRGGLLVRRRVPDLTAVELTHRFLRSTLAPGGLYLDATCGNGHDTLFLCSVAGENGRVIGLDIQPQAAANTNALLAANGMAAIGRAECCDHRELLRCPAGQCGLRDVQLWLAARCRARCTLHGRFHPARAAGRAGRPEARRRACRGAVQRQGDRQCGEKGCGGVFPQPAAGRLYRADLRICQLGRYRSPALLCH